MSDKTLTIDDVISPGEAADMARRYYALKHPRGIVLADGEIVEPKAAEEEIAGLNKMLRQYIEQTGEPIEVEGQPPLILKDTTTWGHYRWEQLMVEAPALFEQLLLKAELKPSEELLRRHELTEAHRWAERGGGTQLRFEDR